MRTDRASQVSGKLFGEVRLHFGLGSRVSRDNKQRCCRQGEIRRNTDPRALALLVFSALEGALVVSRLEGSFRPLQVVAHTLEKHLDEQVVIRG